MRFINLAIQFVAGKGECLIFMVCTWNFLDIWIVYLVWQDLLHTLWENEMLCHHYLTMGIFAAEKWINKEGWNLKNHRKTDKYGSIFEEEITKQLKKWWIRHGKINIWIFKNWKNFMHFHVKSSRFWLFKNWNCYNF